MMRKILDSLLSTYLLPFNRSRRLGLYAKGKILTHEEHYAATIDVARREFGENHDCIIDVGAHDADSSIYLAKAFPRSKVVGFEPILASFKKGLENSIQYKNIVLHNLGLSDIEGEADFYISKDSVSSSLLEPNSGSEAVFHEKTTVRISTLDAFFNNNEKCLLIKLDVQGAELKVLKGGIQTLRNTCLVLTEMLNSDMYSGNCQYYQVDEMLRKSDFQLHALFSNYNNDGVKYFDALYINKKLRKGVN